MKDSQTVYDTKGIRAHTHRELIRKWLEKFVYSEGFKKKKKEKKKGGQVHYCCPSRSLTWAIPNSVFIATPWIQCIRETFGEHHWKTSWIPLDSRTGIHKMGQ